MFAARTRIGKSLAYSSFSQGCGAERILRPLLEQVSTRGKAHEKTLDARPADRRKSAGIGDACGLIIPSPFPYTELQWVEQVNPAKKGVLA